MSRPATDAEIAHGRISLEEMYACEDDCPAMGDRGGLCFRCSIHPAILARLDADAAQLREKTEEIERLREACRFAYSVHEGLFVRGLSLQWQNGEKLDHTPLNEMADKCRAALKP